METNVKAVIYRSADGSQWGSRFAGEFLPKGTYPVAVINSDGEQYPICAEQVPSAIVVDAHRALSEKVEVSLPLMPLTDALAQFAALSGTLFVFDASGSISAPGSICTKFEQFALELEASGQVVVEFNHDEVVPVTGAGFALSGGANRSFLW